MICHRRVALLTATVSLLFVAGATAQTTAWPSEAPPRPLSAHDVQFPSYQMRTLPNGMQVVVVMHHEQPAVSVRLIVRAGSAQDPAGKAGVASLAATLLDQGTATRTAGQIADLVDSVGGESGTGAGRDLSHARVLVMKDSFDLAMNLLADEVRNPSFAEAEIERQRQQLLSAFKVSYDDPEYLANVVFDRLVYGFNPYGTPSNGTPGSLGGITRADLRAFHDRWYLPNNCILAVVGDVTAEEAFAAATRAFGDWARRDVPADTSLDPPPPTRRVIVVDNPDLVQTEVRVGHLGIPRKQNDYMALDLALKILGGEGANRLHRVLRMERGLTYGASAEMETLKRAGEFVAITNTRSEATGEVLRLIVEQFNRLRLQRVNEQELADAKAYLTGNFPLRIETPDDIALQVLNVLFYDLPVEDLQTYRQRVNAVSVDDIARVANGYVRPDRLSVVLVGNARTFVDQLKAVGFDKYEVIPASDIDVTTADLRRRPVVGDGGVARPAGAGGRAGRVFGPAVAPMPFGNSAPTTGGRWRPCASGITGLAAPPSGKTACCRLTFRPSLDGWRDVSRAAERDNTAAAGAPAARCAGNRSAAHAVFRIERRRLRHARPVLPPLARDQRMPACPARAVRSAPTVGAMKTERRSAVFPAAVAQRRSRRLARKAAQGSEKQCARSAVFRSAEPGTRGTGWRPRLLSERPANFRKALAVARAFRPANMVAPMDQQRDAQAVLQRAIQAKGGVDRLRAIKTVLMTGSMTVHAPRPIHAETTSYIEYPDRFRVDAKLPNGELTQVLTASDAWMRDPGGVHDLPADARDSLRSNASRDLVSLLLRAADGKLRVRLLSAGPTEPAGTVDTLELSGAGLAPVDLLIDRSTGMIAGERYIVEQPGAIGKVPTEESYSDYRTVEGVQVAFKIVVRRGAAVILERALTDLKVNVPIDASLFKRPA